MARKDDIGREGESIAARFLERIGYTILERNWRGTRGELDIIARDGDTTVFVEVKTRSGLGYGHPFEAITDLKLARLRRLAGEWCARRPRVGRIRLDIVAVIGGADAPARIEHLQGVG